MSNESFEADRRAEAKLFRVLQPGLPDEPAVPVSALRALPRHAAGEGRPVVWVRWDDLAALCDAAEGKP
jgi:hypothetical protein